MWPPPRRRLKRNAQVFVDRHPVGEQHAFERSRRNIQRQVAPPLLIALLAGSDFHHFHLTVRKDMQQPPAISQFLRRQLAGRHRQIKVIRHRRLPDQLHPAALVDHMLQTADLLEQFVIGGIAAGAVIIRLKLFEKVIGILQFRLVLANDFLQFQFFQFQRLERRQQFFPLRAIRQTVFPPVKNIDRHHLLNVVLFALRRNPAGRHADLEFFHPGRHPDPDCGRLLAGQISQHGLPQDERSDAAFRFRRWLRFRCRFGQRRRFRRYFIGSVNVLLHRRRFRNRFGEFRKKIKIELFF